MAVHVQGVRHGAYPAVRHDQWNSGGCKYCARVAVNPEEALAIMQDAGLDPLEPYPGGNKRPWTCRCRSCGQTVYPLFNTIQQGLGKGRERCGKIRGGLKRRIHEDEAATRMQAAGFRPLVPYPGAMRPWRSRCSCGEVSSPSLHNVQSHSEGREGCRHCRPPYDPDAPGAVYLVYSPGWKAIKVGIMKIDSNRLHAHRREGWLPVDHAGVRCVWPVATIRGAYMIEQRVLAWWQDIVGALPAVRYGDMPQGGASETARLAEIDVDTTVAMIIELVRLQTD